MDRELGQRTWEMHGKQLRWGFHKLCNDLSRYYRQTIASTDKPKRVLCSWFCENRVGRFNPLVSHRERHGQKQPEAGVRFKAVPPPTKQHAPLTNHLLEWFVSNSAEFSQKHHRTSANCGSSILTTKGTNSNGSLHVRFDEKWVSRVAHELTGDVTTNAS